MEKIHFLYTYSMIGVLLYFRVTNLSQEVGYVENVDGPIDFDKFPLGSLLFLLPYHVSIWC